MAPAVLFILIATFLVPTHSHLEPTDQAFTSVVLSQRGLDFLKDLLIDNAISSIIPLQLPNIEKSLKIPFVGTVYMVLSNSTIYEIDVSESFVKPGDTGIVIIASGATCNLSMNWYYSYSTWLVPVQISDTGSASVQVRILGYWRLMETLCLCNWVFLYCVIFNGNLAAFILLLSRSSIDVKIYS